MDVKNLISALELFSCDSEKGQDVEAVVVIVGTKEVRSIERDGVFWDSKNDQIVIYCD